MAGLKIILRIAGLMLCGLLVCGMAVWGALALHYSHLQGNALRDTLATAFALCGLLALVALGLRRWRWRTLGAFAVLFAGLLTWWNQIEPSNDRDWKVEVAVLPYVTFEGDQATVHNIRNFHYRSETDFTPAYYDRTFVRSDPAEDVYLYRLRGSIENVRRILLGYFREINDLHERPEFYNTLLTNCTGNIWLHARVNPGHVPYSWKILLSGHVPEYLHEHGRLDNRLPFSELKRRSHVNAAARAADNAADFSQRIRVGLPQAERVAASQR